MNILEINVSTILKCLKVNLFDHIFLFFQIRCSAVEGTRCDIGEVNINCGDVTRRRRQANTDVEIATGTYVISAER